MGVDNRDSYLLLLPPTPANPCYETVDTAYGGAIGAVLSVLSRKLKNSIGGCTLEIALRVPISSPTDSPPRGHLYDAVQRLVAAVYKLVCVVATKGGYNVEDAAGIDVRILLVTNTSSTDEAQASEEPSSLKNSIGSMPSLVTLAYSERPWCSCFFLDSAEGQQILDEFLQHVKIHPPAHKVPAPAKDLPHEQILKPDTEADTESQHHHLVAVGGTFDHLHIGHKLLLTMTAFLLPNESGIEGQPRMLIAGITGDELLKNKKYAEVLESWDDRSKAVATFLRSIVDFRPAAHSTVKVSERRGTEPNGHAVESQLSPDFILRCVEISDPFGPTITNPDISALVVSGETRAGGKAVNDKRLEKKWTVLQIFEVDVLDFDDTKAEDEQDNKFENKLSSTRIRQAISEKAKALR